MSNLPESEFFETYEKDGEQIPVCFCNIIGIHEGPCECDCGTQFKPNLQHISPGKIMDSVIKTCIPQCDQETIATFEGHLVQRCKKHGGVRKICHALGLESNEFMPVRPEEEG